MAKISLIQRELKREQLVAKAEALLVKRRIQGAAPHPGAGERGRRR